jgi:general secretion pathway protein G
VHQHLLLNYRTPDDGKPPAIRPLFIALTLITAFIVLLAKLTTSIGEVPHLELKIVRAKSDISTLASAVEQFQLETGRYPSTTEGFAVLLAAPPDTAGWHGPYVKPIGDDPWGSPYRYRYPGKLHHGSFDIISVGKDGVADTEDDVTNLP